MQKRVKGFRRNLIESAEEEHSAEISPMPEMLSWDFPWSGEEITKRQGKNEGGPTSNIMAKHILRFRQTDRGIFDDIHSGKKRVETRAATVKYKNIKPGDVVVFVCGEDKFEKIVKSVRVFKDIKSLLKSHKVREIAPQLVAEGDLIKMYHSLPGYEEKILKFGLIALKFG